MAQPYSNNLRWRETAVYVNLTSSAVLFAVIPFGGREREGGGGGGAVAIHFSFHFQSGEKSPFKPAILSHHFWVKRRTQLSWIWSIGIQSTGEKGKKLKSRLKHTLLFTNWVRRVIRSTFDPESILCSSNRQLQSIKTTASIETQSADLNWDKRGTYHALNCWIEFDACSDRCLTRPKSMCRTKLRFRSTQIN